MKITKHLDLGCGARPRNPYGFDEVYGVDISPPLGSPRISAANLAIGPIPFEDESFDAVSAYDFLEHIPRVLLAPDLCSTRFPYIELMNEIWRVLKPNGLFYASTPAYPHQAAFIDPTHVNFLTPDSHIYFTRPHRVASMYGFNGDFTCMSTHLASPTADTLRSLPPASDLAKLRRRYRAWRGHCTHVVWEFRCEK